MDCIVISDDEKNKKDSNNKVEQFNPMSCYPTNNDKDELIAIEIEIAEIDEQLNRLRNQRAFLNKRQQILKSSIKRNQHTTEKASYEQWRRADFPWSSKVNEMRREIFKIDSFRPWQLETINVTLSNHDCILIMPTGGGKSLCYQLPAVISDGITVVVSPLLSLVEDQMYALRNLNIDARSLNASTPRNEQTEIIQILDGKNKTSSTLKILYLTPEKIAKNKSTMAKLQRLYETNRFSRLIIDEVHCVSQYGHDFRPDYKYLSIFKRQFPNLPILGLTATATLKVIDDIRKILKLTQCVLFRAPFNRKNLFYQVYHKSSVGKDTLSDLVNCIQDRFDQQSGIVYCLSQKDAEDICLELQSKNIKAGCYHAGLAAAARTQVHENWLKNEIHVICATIAFGMGIDKPDVRFVIHHSLSKSIENFYQESGRAGRDDKESYCILFFRFADVFRLAPMALGDKSGNGFQNLYSMISYCLNESQCRRKLIARYFDEVWQSNDCNQMCDVCKQAPVSITQRNCREEASMIIDCLNNLNNPKERLTAIKLIDKLSIKSMTKLDLQRLILQMLVDQYLKEDFRFSSYGTICYMKPGPKAHFLKNEKCQILLDIVEKTKQPKSIPKKKPTEKQITKKDDVPTKVVTEVRPRLQSVTNSEPVVKPIRRKRRVVVYDEEEEDDDDPSENNAQTSKRRHI